MAGCVEDALGVTGVLLNRSPQVHVRAEGNYFGKYWEVRGPQKLLSKEYTLNHDSDPRN